MLKSTMNQGVLRAKMIFDASRGSLETERSKKSRQRVEQILLAEAPAHLHKSVAKSSFLIENED